MYINQQQPSVNVDQYVNKQQPSANVDQGMLTNTNHQAMLTCVFYLTTTESHCWPGYINPQQSSVNTVQIFQSTTTIRKCWLNMSTKNNHQPMLTNMSSNNHQPMNTKYVNKQRLTANVDQNISAKAIIGQCWSNMSTNNNHKSILSNIWQSAEIILNFDITWKLILCGFFNEINEKNFNAE